MVRLPKPKDMDEVMDIINKTATAASPITVNEDFTQTVDETHSAKKKSRRIKTFALTSGEIMCHLTRDPKNFKIENLDEEMPGHKRIFSAMSFNRNNSPSPLRTVKKRNTDGMQDMDRVQCDQENPAMIQGLRGTTLSPKSSYMIARVSLDMFTQAAQLPPKLP